MSPKKRVEASRKELKEAAAKLRAKVKGLEKTRADLEKQVRKLTKRLDKAVTAPAEPAPDATWTVARLRAEVAARGITGVPARATKAQLLAALGAAPADG